MRHLFELNQLFRSYDLHGMLDVNDFQCIAIMLSSIAGFFDKLIGLKKDSGILETNMAYSELCGVPCLGGRLCKINEELVCWWRKEGTNV